MQFATDIRFCFTVFEDNEQFEAGDTLTHTWYKPDWPFCTTKWLYLWGSSAGQTCVSTTPPFKYHNAGVNPVPTPDLMFVINSIEPQLYECGGHNVWQTVDVSRDVPVGASGALLLVEHTAAINTITVGIRKKGSTIVNTTEMHSNGLTSVLVGLDANRCFEAQEGTIGTHKVWLYGYTNPNVVFFDTPFNIKPTVNNTYETKDLSSVAPGAILLLTEVGEFFGPLQQISIRALGSTKEIYVQTNHNWPFTALDANGKIQVKATLKTITGWQWDAIGYIKANTVVDNNPAALATPILNTWTNRNANLGQANARFGFIEVAAANYNNYTAARKGGSALDLKRGCDMHNWLIENLWHGTSVDIYQSFAATKFYPTAESE